MSPLPSDFAWTRELASWSGDDDPFKVDLRKMFPDVGPVVRELPFAVTAAGHRVAIHNPRFRLYTAADERDLRGFSRVRDDGWGAPTRNFLIVEAMPDDTGECFRLTTPTRT